MMLGARVDTLVMTQLLKERLPKLMSYLDEELMYDPALDLT